MRKTMLLAAMLALTVLIVGAPAAIADDDRRDDRHDNDTHFVVIEDDNDLEFVDSFDFDEDFDRFDFDGELDQDVEQEAESGDIDQSFDVSQTGDNSSQCAGVQGVANTGNAQNVLDLTQLDGEVDDFEFDEVDSSIEVSPESSTTCDQQVNQAATATG